jgi:hypothetical protein
MIRYSLGAARIPEMLARGLVLWYVAVISQTVAYKARGRHGLRSYTGFDDTG